MKFNTLLIFLLAFGVSSSHAQEFRVHAFTLDTIKSFLQVDTVVLEQGASLVILDSVVIDRAVILDPTSEIKLDPGAHVVVTSIPSAIELASKVTIGLGSKVLVHDLNIQEGGELIVADSLIMAGAMTVDSGGLIQLEGGSITSTDTTKFLDLGGELEVNAASSVSHDSVVFRTTAGIIISEALETADDFNILEGGSCLIESSGSLTGTSAGATCKIEGTLTLEGGAFINWCGKWESLEKGSVILGAESDITVKGEFVNKTDITGTGTVSLCNGMQTSKTENGGSTLDCGETQDMWSDCCENVEMGCCIIGDSPLPVLLLDFRAQTLNNRQVQLDWLTTDELHNSHFAVEHSTDGQSFTQIHIEVAQSNGHERGGKDQLYAYRYTHASPIDGINFYRLRQVDLDGAHNYSGILALNISDSGSDLTVFPNPVQAGSALHVTYRLPDEATDVTFQLFDVHGRLINTRLMQGAKGDLSFSMPSPTASGTYVLHAANLNDRVLLRTVVVH